MNFLRLFRRKSEPQAAELPVLAPPRTPSTMQTVPAYLGKSKGSKIANAAQNTTNLILSDHVRNEATLNQVIKKLVLTSPDLSHAVFTKIHTAISSKYSVLAYNQEGRIDEQATALIQAFVLRCNLGSWDYSKFTRSTDFRALYSSLLYDSFRYGYCASELVLGAGHVPAYIKPIAARLLSWVDNVPEPYPLYKGADKDIPLNYPTVMVSTTVQDGESPYADSPLQTAIQACLWDADFADGLRRTAMKNLFQRLVVTVKSEEYIKSLPLEVQQDQAKLKSHMDALTAELETKLSNLEPDDALVLWDTLEADTVADANRSEDRSIEVLQALINGKVSSGVKILPSILGRGASSNAASTEALLFLKAISSAQLEIDILMSRNLTLAVRLFGYDAYVEFHSAEVNLRPELELESFKAVRQSSMLEQLSLGLITDTECSIALTGKLPPAGYKQLSGTMFKTVAPAIGGNDYSNTSAGVSGKTNSTQAQKDSEAEQKGVKSK